MRYAAGYLLSPVWYRAALLLTRAVVYVQRWLRLGQAWMGWLIQRAALTALAVLMVYGLIKASVPPRGARAAEVFAGGGDSWGVHLLHRPGVKYGVPTLLLLLLGVWVVRRVRLVAHRRELGRIAVAMRRFAHGDLNQRVEVRQNGEIGQLGAVFNQLADRVEVLAERERARKELIADVSHDLLKPVGSIRAYLDTILMNRESIAPEELEGYLRTIHRNTQSLDKLVSEFLYLSKLDSMHAAASLEPFSVADLANDVCMKFMPQAAARHIDLTVVGDPRVGRAYGDVGLMERALSNLVDNAVRYTMPGGKVDLAFSMCDGRVIVKVQDTGTGIAPEDLPKVFEPLFRGRKLGIQDPGGTGLGLTIVRKIAAAHGSQLYVESKPHVGTTIAMTLRPV